MLRGARRVRDSWCKGERERRRCTRRAVYGKGRGAWLVERWNA
jgi:hypothetical protein